MLLMYLYQKLIKHGNARFVQSCLCSVHVSTFCQCWMLFFNLMDIELEVRLIVVVLCSVRDQFLTRSEEIGRVCILFLTLFFVLFVSVSFLVGVRLIVTMVHLVHCTNRMYSTCHSTRVVGDAGCRGEIGPWDAKVLPG